MISDKEIIQQIEHRVPLNGLEASDFAKIVSMDAIISFLDGIKKPVIKTGKAREL